MINLDATPSEAPNPPPWGVLYINDTEVSDGVLPKAVTNGLYKFGFPELMIRLAPPNKAAMILDRVGIWLCYEKGSIHTEETFQVGDVSFQLAREGCIECDKLIRLSWEKDK